MRLEDYNTLHEIVRELRQEVSEVNAEIECNNRYIKQAERYVKSLTESESDDYKVFSPRKPEDIHKDEIDRAYAKKDFCVKRNQELYQRRDVLSGQISRLERVLENVSCEACEATVD